MRCSSFGLFNVEPELRSSVAVHWNGFRDMTPDDLTIALKRREREENVVPYEQDPLVQVFNQLITDRSAGGFWSYADLKSEGAKILGFPPYSDTSDLKQKLDSALTKEIQEKDGLIITYGCKSHGVRGVRIERYQVPKGYQTKLDD